MAGILLPGSARPGGGDIEGVTAGDGLSGGGASGSADDWVEARKKWNGRK